MALNYFYVTSGRQFFFGKNRVTPSVAAPGDTNLTPLRGPSAILHLAGSGLSQFPFVRSAFRSENIQLFTHV